MLGVQEKQYEQQEMAYDKDVYKRHLIEVLKEYDTFCRKHNLRYSVAYGTALGTVRHKGLIPWDDDVDVMMPRADYDRFIQLTMNGMSDICDVVSAYNSPYYYSRYAKVIDNRTTIIEMEMLRRCIVGVFIDVFPMDNTPSGHNSINLCDWQVRLHTFRACRLAAIPFAAHFSLRNSLLCVMMRLFGLNARKEWLKAESKAKKFAGTKSSRMMYYGGTDNYSNHIPSSLFDDIVDMPFEDIEVKCFAKYDAYLTYTYGDYMQLPPVDQRVSHHYHYFIDLDRRWSKEELKETGIIK